MNRSDFLKRAPSSGTGIDHTLLKFFQFKGQRLVIIAALSPIGSEQSYQLISAFY
jgi:hypothetical protein